MTQWNPSDPTEPAILDNLQRETPRANRALRDYCFLGPSRTFQKLLEKYASTPSAPNSPGNLPAESACTPTHSLNALKKWSLTYAWGLRVFSFDEIQRKNEERIYAERRRAIIENGLSLQHERVEKLKLAYAQLEPYLSRPDFIWPRQVKRLPTPDGGFELVETRRFNAEIYTQLRGLLTDISRETNNPDPTASLSTIDNGYDWSKLTVQELEILENLLDKAADLPPQGVYSGHLNTGHFASDPSTHPGFVNK